MTHASEQPDRLLMAISPGPRGTLGVGLEHEFSVSSVAGIVDFRALIHGLDLGQANLDPADPNAHRLTSGAVATCDGAEAEIALPPTPIRPGFAFEVAHRAEVERATLLSRLPSGMRLEGCSTHLSVSMPDALTQRVCHRYATTFAPALMLLMDRRDSPGLLIRPRPGRVELGAEFVNGEHLVAALVFAVGSVLACRDSVTANGAQRLRPPELAVRVEPAVERFGWYVDRTAFGGDLYLQGRLAQMKTTAGDLVSAQTHLERCWAVVSAAMQGLAAPEELGLLRDVVAGVRPLPTEWPTGDDAVPAGAAAPLAPSPYASALEARQRPSFEIAPVMITWDLAVFVVRDRTRGRRGFAAVPGPLLGPFLSELDLGRLDRAIEGHLDRRPSGRRLESRSQALVPALFDELGPRLALLPPEFNRDGTPVAAPVPPARSTAGRRRSPAWWRRIRAERSGSARGEA